MKNLTDLVDALKSDAGETTVALVAVYPRDGNTGLRDLQGAFIDRVLARVGPTLGASVFRLMWSQVAFLIATSDIDAVVRDLASAMKACEDVQLEARAIIASVGGTPNQRVAALDEALGDLSSRRNFGSSLGNARRLVGGTPWSP